MSCVVRCVLSCSRKSRPDVVWALYGHHKIILHSWMRVYYMRGIHINPRHAAAPRVIVVVQSVCQSVYSEYAHLAAIYIYSAVFVPWTTIGLHAHNKFKFGRFSTKLRCRIKASKSWTLHVGCTPRVLASCTPRVLGSYTWLLIEALIMIVVCCFGRLLWTRMPLYRVQASLKKDSTL